MGVLWVVGEVSRVRSVYIYIYICVCVCMYTIILKYVENGIFKIITVLVSCVSIFYL